MRTAKDAASWSTDDRERIIRVDKKLEICTRNT
jgi:hypothetical protein